MNVIDRLNNLAVESSLNTIDGVYTVQRQNLQFFQSYVETAQANQQIYRDLATKLVKQSQEAQSLWFQYWQDAFRTNVDRFTAAAQSGLKEVSEQVERTNNTAKKETAPVK